MAAVCRRENNGFDPNVSIVPKCALDASLPHHLQHLPCRSSISLLRRGGAHVCETRSLRIACMVVTQDPHLCLCDQQECFRVGGPQHA